MAKQGDFDHAGYGRFKRLGGKPAKPIPTETQAYEQAAIHAEIDMGDGAEFVYCVVFTNLQGTG